MEQLLSSLTSETLQIVTYFFAGMVIASIIVSIWGVWTRQIGVSSSDLANLSSAWVVVMATGVAVVFVGVVTGLLGTGIVATIANAIKRATSGTSKPFVSSGDFSWGNFLLLLGMIAIGVSIFSAIAGVVQWSILRKVIDRPVSRWVKGNVQAWTVGVAASLFLAVVMGQLVGLWGFNGALLLGGVITGGSVGEKVMLAGVEKILHERYERSQGNDEQVPQPPKLIPLIASALVVIPSLAIVSILALRAAGTFVESLRTPQPSVAQTIVEVPTVEPTPTATVRPAIPASTFCDGVEQTHPSDTYVCVGSEQGDPVGAGGNWIMTAESSDFHLILADTSGVMVSIQEGSNTWTLSFAAPVDTLLTPGTYDIASNASATNFATLEVSSHSAGRVLSCVGQFEVLAFDHGDVDVNTGYVNVTSFAADFEQECDSSHATLYGKIRINIPGKDMK
jgi:hypothetical protein